MWVFLNIVFFLVCSVIGAPYIIWTLIFERQIFSRLPLILPLCIFLMITQYFYMGGSIWLESRKNFKYKAILVAGSFLLLRNKIIFILILLFILLGYVICRSIKKTFHLTNFPERYWYRKYQISVLIFMFFVLFPIMNYLYLFGGIFHIFGSVEPPLLMENPFYQVNSAGFRGPLLSKERNESNSGVRILFLGDSSTFGFPYRYEKSYPYLVKYYLEKEGLSGIEIINGGMPGQSLIQMALKLDDLLEYDPDIIFLMIGIHYSRSTKHLTKARNFKRPFMNIKHELRFTPPMLLELLFLSASSWKPISGVYKDINIQLYKKTLNEFIACVKRRGIRLIILEYPSPVIILEIQNLIYETAKKHDLDFIPLMKFFPNNTHYAFYDGMHPNLESNRKIAETIVKYLDEIKYSDKGVNNVVAKDVK